MNQNDNFTKYKVSYVNKPLLLFKQKHKITSISYKPQCIDCLTTQNTQDFSLLRERQMNYSKKQRAYAKKVETKIGVINHIKKQIFVYDIDGIFRFENCADKKATMQNMKSLTRDEMEYRKKNINYMLKKIDFEDSRELKYVQGNVKDLYEDVEVKECKTEIKAKKNIGERIKKAILRARIVNYKILVDIFEDEKVIKEIMAEMCVRLKGRFVLKNKYYEKKHRKRREKILKKIEECKSETFSYDMLLTNNSNFDEVYRKHNKYNNVYDIFFIQEICVKTNGFYALKGFSEDISICEQRVEISEVFKDRGVVSMNKMCKELEKDAEDVLRIVEENENLVRLKNNTFVVKEGENQEFRDVIIDVFTRNTAIKKNELLNIIKERTGLEINVFLFGKILKEFATYKANTYYLKNGEDDEK